MTKFICECCDKTWNCKTNFEIHMNRKSYLGIPRKIRKDYVEDRKYECNICKKECRDSWKLQEHHTSCLKKYNKILEHIKNPDIILNELMEKNGKLYEPCKNCGFDSISRARRKDHKEKCNKYCSFLLKN